MNKYVVYLKSGAVLEVPSAVSSRAFEGLFHLTNEEGTVAAMIPAESCEAIIVEGTATFEPAKKPL